MQQRERLFLLVVLVVAFELCCCDARALGARLQLTVAMERRSPARRALKEEVGAISFNKYE